MGFALETELTHSDPLSPSVEHQLYKQMLEADGLWDLLRHGKEKGLEEIDPVVTVTGAYRKLLVRQIVAQPPIHHPTPSHPTSHP